MGEKRNAWRVPVGKPEGKRPLGDPDVHEMIILKWILDTFHRGQCRPLVNAEMNRQIP
jgi:hypothetical protein